MKSYAIRMRLLGPWSTPWHADTLFAALCWQLRWSAGEPALLKFLERLRYDEPPFIVSDVFPEGWFPRPLSARLTPLPHTNLGRKPPEWVPETTFRALLRENATVPPQAEWREPVVSSRRLHASIGRRTGTTAEGGQLFEIPEWRVRTEDGAGGNGNLTVYFRSGEDPDWLCSLFRCLGTSGFGKKRTSGHGAFEIVGEPEPCAWLDDFEGANAFVSLSHFMPAARDPFDGFWRIATKYPKFAAEAPVASPFKGRVTMLCPGSMFRVGGRPRVYYGRILFDLFPEFPTAVHYALAFAAPLRWPPGQAAA
jgi:CRISPR-associated protein Csm4